MAAAKRATVRVSNEDPTSLELLNDYVWTNIRKQYISHIPMESIKELPDFYKVYLGGTAYLVMFAVFAYFTYTSYLSSTTVPFMSLTPGAGCFSVAVNVSGVYQADSGGHWYGQQGFDYTEAIYSMQLSFVDGGAVQFQQALQQFQQDTIQISQLASESSLPRNLLYWMAYIDYAYGGYNRDSTISFQFTGQANVVFNVDYLHGQVATAGGICPLTSIVVFDQANSKMKMTYNYSLYSVNPTCVAAANPFALGYFPTINHNDFSLVVDVNTFAVAAAINFGIINITSLQQVPGQIFVETISNILNVTFGEFFDPRTPLMETLICVLKFTPLVNITSFPSSLLVMYNRLNDRPTCFMRFGGMPVLPVFRHYGAERSTPVPCTCDNGVGSTAACQEFNLLVSFVFYNFPGNQTATSMSTLETQSKQAVANLLLLLNKTENYEEFNTAAYNASWAPVSDVYSESAILTNNKKWRKSAFAFCEQFIVGVGETYCSIISLNPYSATSRSVSEYFYQLKTASCSDTFTVNESTWIALNDNPPAQFTQNYYECVLDTTDALINAAGIAQGNVATVLPILVVFALPVMYIILNFLGQTPPKEEYNFDEKKAALNAFAIQLLRLRDGKVRGMKSSGYLLGLGRELMAAAKLEGGYPDSDDSSEGSDDSDDEEDEEEEVDDKGEGNDEGRKSGISKGKSVRFGGEANIRESLSRAKRHSSTNKKRRSKTKFASTAAGEANGSYDDEIAEQEQPKTRLGDGHLIKAFFQRRRGSRVDDDNTGGTGRASTVGRMSEMAGASGRHSTSVKKPTVVPKRNNMDVFISKAVKDKYKPATESRNTLTKNPLRMTGDVELGSVKHVHLIALNDDTISKDIMSTFQERKAEFVGLSLAEAAKKLLLSMSTAFHEGGNPEHSSSYLDARVIAFALRSVHFDEDDEDVEFAVGCMNVASALSIHISVAMRCDISEVEHKYGNNIGYLIGGQMYSLKKLKAIGEYTDLYQ